MGVATDELCEQRKHKTPVVALEDRLATRRGLRCADGVVQQARMSRVAAWAEHYLTSRSSATTGEPGVDHTGCQFLLLEQRPRAQSRGTATLLPHGHGYVFTTRDRPVRNARGWSAAPVWHGVSAIRAGERHTLALVFHDAA